VRDLLDEYGAAAAARAVAVHVCIGGGVAPIGKKAPLLVAAEEREAKAREALEDAIRQASFLVAQALPDVEAIALAAPQRYADDPAITEGYRANFDRPYNARRPFTLKDARPLARTSARLLREAWELLDPPIEPFKALTNG
jgi:hypothetical protein